MEELQETPPDVPDRVAIVRALPGLGDMLCVVPALRALRAAWPDAAITLVGLPGAGWFVERFGDYVDELLAITAFPGLPELPGTRQESLAFLAAAQARRFDIAVQLHGSGVASNTLTALLGARRDAGSSLPGAWCPDPDRFVEYRDAGHEIDRLLAVVRRLGVAERGRHLEWRALPADGEPVPGVPATPIACLHPGSSLPSRRWPTARFAEIGDHVARAGLGVVVTGTPPERAIADEVAARMRHPAVVVAGRTSLGQQAALLRAAALVVTNDTGISHLTAAVGTPSVVLFTVSDAQRWAPLDRNRHRAVPASGAVPGAGVPVVRDGDLFAALRQCDQLLADHGGPPARTPADEPV